MAMTAKAIGKWAKRGVWLTLAAVMTIGCNPLQTAAFIFHSDEKEPATFPLRPKEKDAPKHDKKEELKVLLLIHQRSGLPPEFASAHQELTSIMAKMLPDLAAENKDKITVLSATQFEGFKAKNPRWKNMNAAEIGKALGADVVLEIYLANVNLYQAGSNNLLYDGKAEVIVDVYDVAAGPGEPRHHYPHPFQYRPNHSPDATEIPPSTFKIGFLNRLGLELCWKHIDHPLSDGIAAR
jgi:hypothetical protein